MSVWKNEKFWCVVAGVVGPTIIKKILKAPKTREYAVKEVDEGMKITADAKAAVQDMKNEAADIGNDEKKEAEAK